MRRKRNISGSSTLKTVGAEKSLSKTDGAKDLPIENDLKKRFSLQKFH